jgi:hypothetical protein
LAGYPAIGVKVIDSGGDDRAVDSNESAFRFAACQGFYLAMRTVGPAMQVTVEVPVTFVGSVQDERWLAIYPAEGQKLCLKTNLLLTDLKPFPIERNPA